MIIMSLTLLVSVGVWWRSQPIYPIFPYNNPSFFFFNDTATTEIYTLSLHDALPILDNLEKVITYEYDNNVYIPARLKGGKALRIAAIERSEEHTSELQSH